MHVYQYGHLPSLANHFSTSKSQKQLGDNTKSLILKKQKELYENKSLRKDEKLHYKQFDDSKLHDTKMDKNGFGKLGNNSVDKV